MLIVNDSARVLVPTVNSLIVSLINVWGSKVCTRDARVLEELF